MQPQINSQWICAQGGGMIINVISKNDERNWDMENMDYKRKGEIIYIYSHNQKIGNMKKFDKEGNLTDDGVRKQLTKYMIDFADFVARLKT